jgi:Holliday junction resolvasome RuvABC endonuclease subunit
MNNTKETLPAIIAVDPSWCSSGIAIFINGKLIKTDKIVKPKDSVNVKELLAFTFKNIIRYIDGPVVLAIETQYLPHGFTSNSTLKVTEAKGIIEGVFLSVIPVAYATILDITPIEAKQSVGVIKRMKRAESKKAVKKAVLELYGYVAELIPNQDVADAVAIGHAAIKKIKAEQILKKFSI